MKGVTGRLQLFQGRCNWLNMCLVPIKERCDFGRMSVSRKGCNSSKPSVSRRAVSQVGFETGRNSGKMSVSRKACNR